MTNYKDYKIVIGDKVQKSLKKLSDKDIKKLFSKIEDLKGDWQHLNIKKLKGYSNVYRLRVDDYRVVFVVIVKDKILVISLIALRKNVYELLNRLVF